MGKTESRPLIGEEILFPFSLPAYLHGILKMENDGGIPSFEFFVTDPEDTLSAKAWRTDSAFNWIYTFHGTKKRKLSTLKRSTGKNLHSTPMIGQMQASSYLCSETRENGSVVNSASTEFVLYDIVQARSFLVQENPTCSLYTTCSFEANAAEKLVKQVAVKQNNTTGSQLPIRRNFGYYDSDASTSSTSYPWLPEDLHPELEIAAIVIQSPFRQNEKLKDLKRQASSRKWTGLPNSRAISQEWEARDSSSLGSAIAKVITPSGRHGSSNADGGGGGPSTLLDRWRYGGGCDCGGWDMGCPLNIFENSYANEWGYNSTQRPILFFTQVGKEKMPALSIMADGRGQYLVDFHARFSTLQAFSICVAILHSSEASIGVGEDKKGKVQYSNSLKLLEEEVRHMIEELACEEKTQVAIGVEQRHASFFLDPPLSPMARV